MNEAHSNRKRFLQELINYAETSNSPNPGFCKRDMLNKLNINDREFYIIQKNLGDKYCSYLNLQEGDEWYAINPKSSVI